MISEYKIYLVIIFWLLLIYFLGVRRYSKLFQNFFNGRPIRYVIKQISQNSFKSFCSGFGVAFLMQSSFGAINHIKSYVQSGLINFKQMGMFLSGGQLASCLSPLILLAVFDIPKKIIIGTLLLSLFLKVFLPKVRFWLVDLLLVSSIFMLSFTELIFASDYISLNFSDYLTPLVVFAIGFLLTIIFKSYLYSSLVFFLLLAKSVDVNSFYIYIFSIHIALALYFLFSSIRYNSSVKKAFLLKVLSVAGAGALMFRFHGQVLLATEELLTPIISNTIYSNLLDSGEDIYKLFNQWLNIKPTYSASHVVYFVVLNLFFVCSFILTNVILVFIVNKFFGKVSSNKPKQMQSLVFPSNTQFYSPYLYLDHFKQEAKKMAAMFENIINIALESDSYKTPESLLRAKKYNLILERVRTETRGYSCKSLKKIRAPYTSQEHLHLLQITEVIEELSRHSLNLLNVKLNKPFTKLEQEYAGKIGNNYDHVFEAFMSNNISIYPTKLSTIKESSEVSKVLDEINIGVLELATILKNINKLRVKNNS